MSGDYLLALESWGRRIREKRMSDTERMLRDHEAEIARLREQNDGLYAAVQMAAKEQERLRKAAGWVVEVDSRYARSFVPPQLSKAIATLRAALDEKP